MNPLYCLTCAGVELNVLFISGVWRVHTGYSPQSTRPPMLNRAVCLIRLGICPAGKPGFLHQGGDKPEHARAHDNLLWWGPEEDFQPDGKGFIPPLPQVSILSWLGQLFQHWVREAERSQEFCRLSLPGPPVRLIPREHRRAEMPRLYAWNTWGQILICIKHQGFIHVVA